MSAEPRFIPRLTADGSYTFFSQDFGECFHSHHGAQQEAVGKFVRPTRITPLAQQSRLTLLDICYGLGYNSAAALDQIWRVNPQCQVQLIALESDPEVPQAALAQGWLRDWSPQVQRDLQTLATEYQCSTPTLEAQLVIGDARQTIQQLLQQTVQADAIFLDPFSPPHCPQLWTVEFFGLIRQCLHPQGRLATYSCAAAVRAGLQAAGWVVGASPPVGRRSPGTIAALQALDGFPLSDREQEHLRTKAAIPYHDPTLTSSAADILERRIQSQQISDLEPTRAWKQRWAVALPP